MYNRELKNIRIFGLDQIETIMRTSTRQLVLTLLSLMLTVSVLGNSGDREKEEFEQLSEKLEEAIEVRNFHDARATMEELMPMMKKELKEDKKLLSELQKADAPETDPVVFKQQLERKTELYNSLKKLVNISPAALRVKAQLIKAEVNEFIELS